MFNWKLRYIFIKFNSTQSKCLALRPTKYFILEGTINHWHCLKLLEHGDNQMRSNSQSVLLLVLHALKAVHPSTACRQEDYRKHLLPRCPLYYDLSSLPAKSEDGQRAGRNEALLDCTARVAWLEEAELSLHGLPNESDTLGMLTSPIHPW